MGRGGVDGDGGDGVDGVDGDVDVDGDGRGRGRGCCCGLSDAKCNFVLLSLIYAFIFAGGGFVGIFLPILFSVAGVTSRNVGIISAAAPIAGIIGAPLLGLVFDRRRQWRKQLYVVSSCVSFAFYLTIPCWMLLLPTTFPRVYPLVTCVMMASAISSASGVLLEALAVESVQQNQYGKLRLFGAMGYGVGAAIESIVLLIMGNNNGNNNGGLWMWVAHYAPACVTNVVGLSLAMALRKTKQFKEEPQKKQQSNDATESEMLMTTEQRQEEEEEEKKQIPSDDEKKEPLGASLILSLALFCIAVLICGAASGLINAFLFVFINTLPDASPIIMGLSVTVTTLFEIPVFLSSPYLLNHIRMDWLVLISLIAYCIRLTSYFLFSIYKPSAWFALLSEPLHGLTFALLWAATVARAQSLVLTKRVTSGLAMSVASGISGIGRAAGSFGAGAALEATIPFETVWLSALIFMGGLAFIWFLWSAISSRCTFRAVKDKKGIV